MVDTSVDNGISRIYGLRMGKRKSSGRGGVRPGAGRPALPRSKKRSARVLLKLTPAEARELRRHAKREPLATFARAVLLRALRRS
jgi:hypothetical protein